MEHILTKKNALEQVFVPENCPKRSHESRVSLKKVVKTQIFRFFIELCVKIHPLPQNASRYAPSSYFDASYFFIIYPKKITSFLKILIFLLIIQKPSDESSVLFEWYEKIKLTTIISASFWSQKNGQNPPMERGAFFNIWGGCISQQRPNRLFKNYVRIFGIWVLEPKVFVQNAPIIQPGILVHFCLKWGCIG